ncbi:putative quinol monooxygenase, partial [Rhizobium johnstonii]|uniref:putative quinol monooxygenase n=1 Tax=Rhizobium johnstonii TaxID=3019933 RepID=UPI003F9DFF31
WSLMETALRERTPSSSAMDHPNRIRILEVYADQEAYEAHLRTPHFLKYKNQTAQMVTSLTIIEVDPIAMRAKP